MTGPGAVFGVNENHCIRASAAEVNRDVSNFLTQIFALKYHCKVSNLRSKTNIEFAESQVSAFVYIL